MPRNVLCTKTGRGALVSIGASVLLGICTHFSDPMQRRFPAVADLIKATSDLIIDIAPLVGVVGGSTSIAGRMSATSDVYSPRFLPGRNKEDTV